MKIDYFTTRIGLTCDLQTFQIDCNLQTISKLEPNKLKGLRLFLDCNYKLENIIRKLQLNPITTGPVEYSLDCTETPSLYERGEYPRRGSLLSVGKSLSDGGCL